MYVLYYSLNGKLLFLHILLIISLKRNASTKWGLAYGSNGLKTLCFKGCVLMSATLYFTK